MKIFNWVQRRFHHGAVKDGLARNVKKAESITNEADKQALLKQVALVDVLDGWKDGILTIGTLGLDPLKPFNQQNDQYFILESEEEEEEEEEKEAEMDSVDDDYFDDDNVEDEEVNPLIYATFEHSFEGIGTNTVTCDVITSSSITEQEQRKQKRERITLAELFLEDADMKKKLDSVEIETKSGHKKPVARAKGGLSFAKKLLRPRAGEDPRLIKKFNQLMRRMLKRKIHPEFDGKGNKTDDQNKAGIMDVQICKGKEAESVFLLQTASACMVKVKVDGRERAELASLSFSMDFL
ncbi:hypothetical protein OIU77_010510 [Salix suchowensis]|uniref:Protein TILLER ANGLE CONTROL 1 n=1 Tax=Salix suchowensis TaxID=1278906 RepID=A0ABQ9A8L8_9ROSI|nr:hypothetical protein OIU77_010510 [Salix suchowensis]